MKATTGKRAALEVCRRVPELEPPLEYYAGRIIQKLATRLVHSIIQSQFLLKLHTYCRPAKLGDVYLELRSTFGGISIVPDLSYFRQDRMPDPTNPVDREDVLFAPDLIIEILSPNQTVGELSRKLRSAIRRGVRLGWLIDEGHRTVHVFHPTGKPQVLRSGDVLSGEDIVPGFALLLDEMFGWVDEN